nr:hypothetical protein [Methylobacterium durans]
MPHCHFHLRTLDGLQWDPEGVPFYNLEEAYLDVCQSITTIAADLAQVGTRRTNLMRYAFENSDAQGRFLMKVPFWEVLPPDRKPRRPSSLLDRNTGAEMERTRRTIVAVGQERDALYVTLSQTHTLLARLHAKPRRSGAAAGGAGEREDLSLQSLAREGERGRVDSMAILVPHQHHEHALVTTRGDQLAGNVRQERLGLRVGFVRACKLCSGVVELGTAVVDVEEVAEHLALRGS